MSTTVRVSDATHARLRELARATGTKIQTLVDEAVAAYQAERFWDAFESGYDRLAVDPQAWADVERERAGEATSLTDGAHED